MKKSVTNIILIVFTLVITVSCTDASNKTVENKSETQTENTQPDKAELIDNWLKLGLKQESVIEKLGVPEKKGKDVYWGAIGTYNQEWNYKSQGILLTMESDNENGLKTVAMITLIEPCTMKTSQKIGIGTDKKVLYDKYSELIDNTFSSETSIVVGSIYGGVIFSLTDNKVSKIFVGTAAE